MNKHNTDSTESHTITLTLLAFMGLTLLGATITHWILKKIGQLLLHLLPT